MKLILSIALITFFSLPCHAAKDDVEIEIQQINGTWASVINVHGFYDNESAALDIIRDLLIVSKNDKTAMRDYRIKK